MTREREIYQILYEDIRARENVIYANLLLKNNFKKLRRKPFKGIHDLVNGNLNIHTVVESGFIRPDFEFEELDNIGKTIAEKCRVFYDDLSRTLMTFNESDEEERQSLLNLEIIYKIYNRYLPECTEYLSGDKFYSFLSYALQNPLIFSPRDTNVYKDILYIFKDQELGARESNEEIGFKYGLTAERVRQLGQSFFSKIEEKLEQLKLLNLGLCIDDFIKGEDIIHLTPDILTICKDEGVRDFNGNFIAYVLSFFLADYKLIGNYRNHILGQQYNNKHNWKNLYLVHSEIGEAVDFIAIFQDLHFRLVERIEETYEIRIEDILYKYRKTDGFEEDIYRRLVAVFKYILQYELNLSITEEDSIVIERNTILLIWEYTYIALKKLDQPSFLEDIMDKLVELFPDQEFNISSVRSSMITRDEFTHIGRQSKYGLKKWEKLRKNFKGGTIRDIVEEYICTHGETQEHHINDIAEYVLKYRPTTTKGNIYSNILLERNKRFLINRPGYISLGNK